MFRALKKAGKSANVHFLEAEAEESHDVQEAKDGGCEEGVTGDDTEIRWWTCGCREEVRG